jgi:hypothetical protein
MKNWFSKIVGKEAKPPPADGDAAVVPQAGAERTMPADIGRTVILSKPAVAQGHKDMVELLLAHNTEVKF